MIGTVYASTSVNVLLMNPSEEGAKGISSGGYWVGEIPVKISNSTIPASQTVAYCINYDKTITLAAHMPLH